MPPFATHPPEFAYMKVERISLPCLYVKEGKRGAGREACLLVSGGRPKVSSRAGAVTVRVPGVRDHAVVVLKLGGA